jgi:aspartyl-tRNA(Asn)/glutamyl-tRNA(Gln) amidotransferase subunit A
MPPAQQALLGPDVRAAQQAGQGYSATDYIAAQRARSAVNVGMWQVFKQVKVLVTPTIATTTPEAGATTAPLGDAVVPILDALNALTVPANVTGMPAITVPTGVGADGLPVGLQIMAPPLEELSILTVAHVYESLTEFSQMRPF